MKKALPIGIKNYRKLKEDDYYHIDKSLIIKEFLERKTEVTLITRPRRFGKTLNMSMMAEFFDITKDSKDLFKDTKIMETEYCSYLNQYPTIFISFADAKGNKYSLVQLIKEQLQNEYDRYKHIFVNLTKFEQINYERILNHLANSEDGCIDNIITSLSFLMKILEKYYGKRVMVFIDEYDTPFIEAHVGEFYDEIRSGLASMLHNALKTSNSLQYAMLTGIQRIAKENIFSDLNNPVVCTVNDKRYSQYFGFNEDEVKELLSYYGLKLNERVKEMYDGYHIGDNEVYNPWSLINYADTKILEPYWVNTSANKMIKYAMSKADASFKDDYEFLIENGYLDTDLLLETSFFEQSETYSLWGLFVNAGYLTIEWKVDDEYHLVIPNREVQREIKALTAYYLQIPESSFDKLIKSLRKSDEKLFKQSYQKLLMLLPSYHDLKDENSYHMMLLGLCAGLSNEYEIKSNREEGLGRCDIILKSLSNQVSYIIEFKYTKNKDSNLDDLANQAVKQIKDNKYDAGIEGKVIYIGLEHYHKQVKMKWIHK